jgi:hypothetical protein
MSHSDGLSSSGMLCQHCNSLHRMQHVAAKRMLRHRRAWIRPAHMPTLNIWGWQSVVAAARRLTHHILKLGQFHCWSIGGHMLLADAPHALKLISTSTQLSGLQYQPHQRHTEQQLV